MSTGILPEVLRQQTFCYFHYSIPRAHTMGLVERAHNMRFVQDSSTGDECVAPRDKLSRKIGLKARSFRLFINHFRLFFISASIVIVIMTITITIVLLVSSLSSLSVVYCFGQRGSLRDVPAVLAADKKCRICRT